MRLARDGCALALADVDEEGACATLELVQRAGGSGHVERLDVSDARQWQALRARLEDRWEHLDLLVNNAGVGCSGEVGALSLENWQWALGANLMGAIYGSHTFLGWLKRNPHAPGIVNIASVAGVISPPSMGAYNVSKAGVIALSETLYGELRGQNVSITCVCPGFFPTEILKRGRFMPHERDAAEQYMQRARISAADVADRTLNAVARKELYVFIPRRARRLWWLKRAAPVLLLRLVALAYRRSTKGTAVIETAPIVPGSEDALTEESIRAQS